jgi:hypothetical protein
MNNSAAPHRFRSLAACDFRSPNHDDVSGMDDSFISYRASINVHNKIVALTEEATKYGARTLPSSARTMTN